MKVSVLFFRNSEDKDPENEGTFELPAVPRIGETIEDADLYWDVTSVFWRVSDGEATVQCTLSAAQGDEAD